MTESSQTVDQLNKRPISKVAKRFLQQAKQKPDPSVLYVYQLMEWALSTKKIEIEEVANQYATTDLLEVVRKLMYLANPERALDFLTKEGPDPGNPQATWVDPKELMRQKTPEEAAAYLAEALWEALIEIEETENLDHLD